MNLDTCETGVGEVVLELAGRRVARRETADGDADATPCAQGAPYLAESGHRVGPQVEGVDRQSRVEGSVVEGKSGNGAQMEFDSTCCCALTVAGTSHLEHRFGGIDTHDSPIPCRGGGQLHADTWPATHLQYAVGRTNR